jgi:hypothetical protein
MYDEQEGIESSSRIVDEYGDGHSLDGLQGRDNHLQTYSSQKVKDEFFNNVWSVLDNAGNLLISKNHDYGPKSIAHSPGGALNGLRVRMHDKMARLNHLLDSNLSPAHESIRDTLVDLLNYSAIAIMVLDKKWPELPND